MGLSIKNLFSTDLTIFTSEVVVLHQWVCFANCFSPISRDSARSQQSRPNLKNFHDRPVSEELRPPEPAPFTNRRWVHKSKTQTDWVGSKLGTNPTRTNQWTGLLLYAQSAWESREERVRIMRLAACYK